MTRRRRSRGPQPAALFTWNADGDVQAGEARVNPLSVACDWEPCRRPIGERCPVAGGAHPSRRDKAARAAAPKPTETPPSAATTERTEPTG